MAKTFNEVLNELRTMNASTVGDLIAHLNQFNVGQAGPKTGTDADGNPVSRFETLPVPNIFTPAMIRKDRLPAGVTPEAVVYVLNMTVGGRTRAKAAVKTAADFDAAFVAAQEDQGLEPPTRLGLAGDRVADELVCDLIYRSKGLKGMGTIKDRADERAELCSLAIASGKSRYRGLVVAAAEALAVDHGPAEPTAKKSAGGNGGAKSRKGSFGADEAEDEAAE